METLRPEFLMLYTQCQVSMGQSLLDKAKSLAGQAVDSAVDSVKAGADWVSGAVQGAGAMVQAYSDMRDANWVNSDKYFHARGNFDAAQHGPGGVFAAGAISDARELFDRVVKGDSAASSAADQAANEWGRGGGDPNVYRPKGLPSKYKK